MRKWIIAGVILGSFAVLACAALLNINTLLERNKDYLIDQAQQALGRNISVKDIKATLFTGLGVRLTDFTITDDPAFSSGNFVHAKDLQVNLRFWPLLKREVQIKRVILRYPEIRIVRNLAGEYNFSGVGKKDHDAKRQTMTEMKKDEIANQAEASGSSLLVSLVDISGGDLRYIDKKEGADLRFRHVDLEMEDLDLAKPLSIKLAAALYSDKQNLRISTRVDLRRWGEDFSQAPLDGRIDMDALDMTRLKAALPQVKSVLPKDLDISGAFRIQDVRFRGTLKDLALTGEINGTNGALRYGKSFQKAVGIPLTFNTDARYRGDKIFIRNSTLRLHTLKLVASGDIQLGESVVLNLAVDSEPASLDGWEKLIPAMERYQLTGNMKLQGTVRGKAAQGAVPQIHGTLALKKVSAKPPNFPKPIEDLETNINFTGQRADVKDMTLSLGKSRIRLAAAIEKFSPLTLTYKLSTPEIWPADYRAMLSEERKADVIRNLVSEGQLTTAEGGVSYQSKLTSADGTLFNVPYKGLDLTLSLANQVADIRSLRVNALNGAIQMQGAYFFKEPVPSFSIASTVQGIDAKELYSALDSKADNDIRGRVNAQIKLTGNGQNWEEIKMTLRGQGNTEVLEGALLNFNIADGALTGITGIPGLTNAIKPELRKKYPETFTAKDTEFKELKADFDLAEGRMNVKNLRLSAADLLVQGKGWADLSRRVDFRSTLYFSKPLSADLSQSTRELKYLSNDQGELEVPFALTGKLPHVKAKPDMNHIGRMVQRGWANKAGEELQNRFFGSKPSLGQEDDAPADAKKKKKKSTEDLIRRGLENLFRR